MRLLDRGMACAVSLLLAYACSVVPLLAQETAEKPARLRVLEWGVGIPLPDYQLTTYLGKRLPLFQENRFFYIVKMSTAEAGDVLCAFPKKTNQKSGTAWVTAEQIVIFGTETHSEAGIFYLQQDETLDILRETDTDYIVQVERHGNFAALAIPKTTDGLIYEEPAPQRMARRTTPAERRTTPAERRTTPAERRTSTTRRPPPHQEKQTHTITRSPDDSLERTSTAPTTDTAPVPTPKSIARKLTPSDDDFELPPGVTFAHVTPESAQSPAEKKAEQLRQLEELEKSVATGPEKIDAEDEPDDTASEVGDGADEETADGSDVTLINEEDLPEDAQPRDKTSKKKGLARAMGFITNNSLTFIVLLIAVIIEAILIGRLHKSTAPLQSSSEEVMTFTTIGESMTSDYLQNLTHESGDFSGSFKGFSVTELVQFLHSAQETGVLVVKDTDQQTIGEFFFEMGELIDAEYEKKKAEDALHALFRGTNDSFTFNRRPDVDRKRVIKGQTMGLLLEVSRQMDEEKAG